MFSWSNGLFGKLVILFVIGLMLPVIGYTLQSYTIPAGSNVTISEFGICRLVLNNTHTTNSAADIASFESMSGTTFTATDVLNQYAAGQLGTGGYFTTPSPNFGNSPYMTLAPPGLTVFISTNTAAEWTSFLNNPPIGVDWFDCCGKYC